MNAKPMVITINREYGAGGRTVAKALSEALNIPWYDKDFIKLTAEKSGLPEDEIRSNSEELSRKANVFNTIFANASYTSAEDAVFQAQRKVMIELAASPCIIVGRCSNYIYRDAGIPSFDILLHADMDFKVKRAMELNEYNNTTPEKYVIEETALRQYFYKHHSKHDMSDCHEYDICLDVSHIGTQQVCDILITLLKDAFK